MAEELAFKDAAAAEYDRAFAHVTAHLHALPVAGCSHHTGYARPRHRHGRRGVARLFPELLVPDSSPWFS